MKYGEIYATAWATMADWTDDERLVSVYLRSSKHANGEGLSEIPAAYAAHDLRWDTARVERAYDELAGRGWLVVEGDWVLVIDGLEHKQPKTDAHRKGAANRIEGAPVTSGIYARFVSLVEVHCPELLAYLPGTAGVPLECHPDGTHEGLESSSPSPTSSSSPNTNSSSSPPASRADASTTGAGPAGIDTEITSLWLASVKPELERVPEWAAEISRMGDAAAVALLRGNRDAPWPQLAARAVSQKLLPASEPAALRTPSPMRALELKLADHRKDSPAPSAEDAARRDQDARAWEESQRRRAAEREAWLATPEGLERTRQLQEDEDRLNGGLGAASADQVMGLSRVGR